VPLKRTKSGFIFEIAKIRELFITN
jgi:hypothetical protein